MPKAAAHGVRTHAGRGLPLRRLPAMDLPFLVLVLTLVGFGLVMLGSASSAVALVDKYPNLLVVHTFSKSRSLAGMRIGFAMGHAGLIEALERVKNSFNSYPLDRLALAGAVASLEDEDYFQQTCRQVIATREQLVTELQQLGFEVLPSAANFVFARHPQHAGAALAQALRDRSIIVRHFAKPRIDAFLRISIGTDAECQQLVAALTEILQA